MKTSTFLLAAGAAILLQFPAQAETVVSRTRVGNNTEGMTFAPSGRWKDHALAIDGNDVIAISLGNGRAAGCQEGGDDRDDDRDDDRPAGLSGPGWQKIFDVVGQPWEAHAPRGIVYVPTLRQFWFASVQPAGATWMYRADESGKPLPPLALTGLGDLSTWSDWEGLAFMPPGAALHPNSVAAFSYRNDESGSRLYFLDPQTGAVLDQVLPQAGTPLENYLCGVQYEAARQRFLVTACSETIYAMGLDGSFLGIVQSHPGAGGIESIVFDRRGRMFINGYGSGRLWAHDAKYRPVPSLDKSFVIGAGASVNSFSWNPDAGEYEVLQASPPSVVSLSADLSSARTLFTFDAERYPAPSAISYLGGGQVAVATRGYPRGLGIFDLASGGEVERLVLEGPTFPGWRRYVVAAVGAWAPGQLAVRFPQGPDPFAGAHLITTGGDDGSCILPGAIIPSLEGELTFDAPTGGNVFQRFDDGSGPKIFTGGALFDTSGHLLHTIDAAALALTEGVQTGTWISGNRFAVVDGQTSTVVIFTVP